MNKYILYFIISLFISTILYVFYITFLKIYRFGQMIREEGPKTHFKKQGTPSTGGVIIIVTTTIVYLIYTFRENIEFGYSLLLILPIILYGLIGFIDDYLIIVRNNNKGLKPKTKLLLQIVFAGIYFYLFLNNNFDTKINIFNLKIDLKFLYGVFVLLMFISTSNAVNLSDGMDGLAGGMSIITLFSLMYLALYRNNIPVTIYTIILIASIIGFICYNLFPAKVFMGDTGSLAIGAAIANIFILLKMELLILIIGLMFIVETSSVIIQVMYFKKSKGKRIFLMTPLHHHFELKGHKELTITIWFWLFSLLFAIIGIIIGIKFY